LETLNNRLKKLALFTSPIIAAYGVAPVFILKTISTIPLIVAFLALTILIALFWWINILLFGKVVGLRKRFTISYIVTFLFQTLVLTLLPQFPDQQNVSDFLFYSISSTVAINTIILIIINSESLKHKKGLADFEIQNLKLANLEAQKQVLMQQLQPHFLFNALSTLKSLITENPEKAEEYAIHLSDFLRYSVHSNENDLVTLEKECEFTKDFLNLQKVRFGSALQWTININEHEYRKLIPVLSLQTVVENAIKHNTFTENKPLNISIHSNKFKITVSNDKSPKQIVVKSGIGLKNLSNRYSLLTQDGLMIEETENNFTVHLKLLEK
jgi:sensor histidine kinase YesM